MKIIVENAQKKQELLEASEHIHYLLDVDTDIPMVNTICHLYMTPDSIEIEPKPKEKTIAIKRSDYYLAVWLGSSYICAFFLISMMENLAQTRFLCNAIALPTCISAFIMGGLLAWWLVKGEKYV